MERLAPAARAPRRQALRYRLRLPHAVVAVTAGVVLAGLVYLGARETSLFAVRAIEVTGASEAVAAAVERALEPVAGTSLVALDVGDVERRVEALPSVVSAHADRDFPHTLRVAVRMERPVAVVRQAGGAWVVSARGRVIAGVEPGELLHLPRVWLPQAGEAPAPGRYLLAGEGGEIVRALARVPEGFPERVEAARGTPDSLVLVLRGKTEVRLGEAGELRLKLAVAATVLESLPGAERRQLAYLDVSLPTRPVSALKPQVEA